MSTRQCAITNSACEIGPRKEETKIDSPTFRRRFIATVTGAIMKQEPSEISTVRVRRESARQNNFLFITATAVSPQ